MEFEDDLKIYGSYEKNTKTIKGHNNIRYAVGGTARHNIRSNIIDWKLIQQNDNQQNDNQQNDNQQNDNQQNDNQQNDKKIKIINDILNLPEYISDQDSLIEILKEVSNTGTLEFLIKSLNLNEPIIIQLRRLFYILKSNNSTNPNHNDITFCPYDSQTRLNNLLNKLDGISIDVCKESNLRSLIDQIIALYDKKKSILAGNKAQYEKEVVYGKTLDESIDVFMQLYKNNYQNLFDIENINIDIAQILESISDLLD
jgi:hypothetical protein